MNHIFDLVMGDPSSDGHGITDTVSFECTHSLNDVLKLYDMTVKLYGFDITEECEGYEESELSEAFRQSAKAAFASDPATIQIIDVCEQDRYIDSDAFATLFMKMAQLSDVKMQFKQVRRDSRKIGGYGLFSN